MGNDDVETISSTTLEDHDQTPWPGSFDSAECRASQKAGDGSSADYGQSSVAKESSASDGHDETLRRDVACYVFPIPTFIDGTGRDVANSVPTTIFFEILESR